MALGSLCHTAGPVPPPPTSRASNATVVGPDGPARACNAFPCTPVCTGAWAPEEGSKCPST